MPNKTILVKLRPGLGAIQYVRAVKAEMHGEHLAFVDAKGRLAALFLLNTVESWNEVEDGAGALER